MQSWYMLTDVCSVNEAKEVENRDCGNNVEVNLQS